MAYGGVSIGRLECFVEYDETVVAIQHDVACVDGARPAAVGSEGTWQIAVLLVAVQLAQVHRKGKQGGQLLCCTRVGQLGGEVETTHAQHYAVHLCGRGGGRLFAAGCKGKHGKERYCQAMSILLLHRCLSIS